MRRVTESQRSDCVYNEIKENASAYFAKHNRALCCVGMYVYSFLYIIHCYTLPRIKLIYFAGSQRAAYFLGCRKQFCIKFTSLLSLHNIHIHTKIYAVKEQGPMKEVYIMSFISACITNSYR